MNKEVKGKERVVFCEIWDPYFTAIILVDCLKILVIKPYNMFNKIQLNCNLSLSLYR